MRFNRRRSSLHYGKSGLAKHTRYGSFCPVQYNLPLSAGISGWSHLHRTSKRETRRSGGTNDGSSDEDPHRIAHTIAVDYNHGARLTFPQILLRKKNSRRFVCLVNQVHQQSSVDNTSSCFHHIQNLKSGHTVPLRARGSSVLTRRCRTENAIDRVALRTHSERVVTK